METGKKLIKDMTREERNEYNKARYEARTKGSLNLTIVNCPDDLREAILAAIKESK